jgi:HSP20 family protein
MYRRFGWPSMWSEMDRLQREMNRLFDRTAGQRVRMAPSFPAINIWASEDQQVLTAEVPGFDPDEIEVKVIGDVLTISGQRGPEEHPADVRYHRRERGYGSFTRSIELSYQVDAGKVEATFKNGIIEIDLPRAEEDKPRKIAVKSA